MPSRGGTARPSVLLVREWEQQMSSSGCCGRLEGDFLTRRGERCFPERRNVMEAMGPLYRDLRSQFGDHVEINVVDPRNMGTVFGLLLRDFRAHRPGLREALNTLLRFSITSVIVNGRLISRGEWPTLEDVEAALGPEAIRGGRAASGGAALGVEPTPGVEAALGGRAVPRGGAAVSERTD